MIEWSRTIAGSGPLFQSRPLPSPGAVIRQMAAQVPSVRPPPPPPPEGQQLIRRRRRRTGEGRAAPAAAAPAAIEGHGAAGRISGGGLRPGAAGGAGPSVFDPWPP